MAKIASFRLLAKVDMTGPVATTGLPLTAPRFSVALLADDFTAAEEATVDLELGLFNELSNTAILSYVVAFGYGTVTESEYSADKALRFGEVKLSSSSCVLRAPSMLRYSCGAMNDIITAQFRKN